MEGLEGNQIRRGMRELEGRVAGVWKVGQTETGSRWQAGWIVEGSGQVKEERVQSSGCRTEAGR